MLVGDSGVGKSSIVSCVCHGEVDRRHLATIGVDFHSTNATINGARVKLQIVRRARRIGARAGAASAGRQRSVRLR